MKISFASAIMIAALVSCVGSVTASACVAPIDLAAINRRIADPDLSGDLRETATALKTRAAAAIEAGHRDEGRSLYYRLMSVLGISSSSGRYRCG